MSVGFRLRGHYRRNFLGKPAAMDVLRQAAGAWRELEPDLVLLEVDNIEGIPTLTIQAHPAVEPLSMTVPSAGALEVSANTSTGGPGYHRQMIRDVRAIGERLDIAWDSLNDDDVLDETGYFEGGEPGAVDAAMLRWIGALLGKLQFHEGRFVAIAMPIGYRAAGSDSSEVITAMGPRDRAWVARGAVDPSQAADFFAWWGDDRDATHYRNRALARMWVDVRWSEPVDDESREHLVRADRDLTRSYELDTSQELPWREWSEIRGILREPGSPESTMDHVIKERAAAVGPNTRLVGFRRGSMPVTVNPGWTITIPGSFHETSDGDSWIGYDHERSVRLASMTITGKDGSVPTADELAANSLSSPYPIRPGDDALRGGAEIRDVEEDGRQFRALQGEVIADGQVLIITIVCGQQEEWARETYRSISFNPDN